VVQDQLAVGFFRDLFTRGLVEGIAQLGGQLLHRVELLFQEWIHEYAPPTGFGKLP